MFPSRPCKFAPPGDPANAGAISYDISVNSPTDSSGWYGGLSWDIPGLPILGTITVDDQSNLVDSFSLTAGPTSWSEANFATTPALSFDSGGNLISFNLYDSYSLPSGIYKMQLRSDFFELFDGNNVAGCHGCVSFSAQAPPPIPEPVTVALLSVGLAGLVFVRRKGVARFAKASLYQRQRCATMARVRMPALAYDEFASPKSF